MDSNTPPIAVPGPAANDPGPARLVMPGRRLRAAAGARWVADGWRLFRQATLMWIVFVVLFFLVNFGLSLVPWAGMWLGNLVSPILMGGIALGCRSLETGGDLELEHLLAGFRRNTGMLFAIGALYALGEVAIIVVLGFITGFPLVLAILAGDAAAMARAIPEDLMRLALGGLVASALAVPLVAAYWFAPALAMLHDIPALPAMKESFMACMRNFLPMLVYGLLMGLLAIVAIIPLGLGLVAWLPLVVATIYASYRSVFTEPDAEAL